MLPSRDLLSSVDVIVDCPNCETRHVILDRAPGTVALCHCGAEIRLPHNQLDAIKCANCGGNPPPDATRCTYCDAHLATLRCGRCFAASIEGDRHCRACGHELAVPARPHGAKAPPPLNCPRCDVALVSVMIGDAVLDECRRCGGEWLGQGLFDEVMRDRRHGSQAMAAIENLLPARERIAPAPPQLDEPFYIKCPECSDVMDRRQFAKISGVVVDVCRQHGLWFDRDELAAIVDFVGSGGMERAEQYMHERRLAQLKRRRAGAAWHDLSNDGELLSGAGHALAAVIALLMR